MWNLEEDSGAVSGRFIGPGGSTVVQVEKNLLAVFDNRMFPLAGDIHNGTDPTRIVLPSSLV